MDKKRFEEHFSTVGKDWEFTIDRAQSVADRYQNRFGNLNEIIHPAILTKVGFITLLARAVETGRALTRKDIEVVYPGVKGWEEIQE